MAGNCLPANRVLASQEEPCFMELVILLRRWHYTDACSIWLRLPSTTDLSEKLPHDHGEHESSHIASSFARLPYLLTDCNHFTLVKKILVLCFTQLQLY